MIINISRFTENDLETLNIAYANNTAVQSFISNCDEQDVAAVLLDVNSTSVWTMSPPSFQKFLNDLRENVTVKIRYTISIMRRSHEPQADVVETSQIFYLNGNDSAREELIRILDGEDRNQLVHLPLLFPKFLKVANTLRLNMICMNVDEINNFMVYHV